MSTNKRFDAKGNDGGEGQAGSESQQASTTSDLLKPQRLVERGRIPNLGGEQTSVRNDVAASTKRSNDASEHNDTTLFKPWIRHGRISQVNSKRQKNDADVAGARDVRDSTVPAATSELSALDSSSALEVSDTFEPAAAQRQRSRQISQNSRIQREQSDQHQPHTMETNLEERKVEEIDGDQYVEGPTWTTPGAFPISGLNFAPQDSSSADESDLQNDDYDDLDGAPSMPEFSAVVSARLVADDEDAEYLRSRLEEIEQEENEMIEERRKVVSATRVVPVPEENTPNQNSSEDHTKDSNKENSIGALLRRQKCRVLVVVVVSLVGLAGIFYATKPADNSTSASPSVQPTVMASVAPSAMPSSHFGAAPSRMASTRPSAPPTSALTLVPSTRPSSPPTKGPTLPPSNIPSSKPTTRLEQGWLSDGVATPSFNLSQGMAERFFLNPSPDVDNVVCTTIGTNGDAVLYMSWEYWPTLGIYNCVSDTNRDSNEMCAVGRYFYPARLHVMVWAADSFTGVVLECSTTFVPEALLDGVPTVPFDLAGGRVFVGRPKFFVFNAGPDDNSVLCTTNSASFSWYGLAYLRWYSLPFSGVYDCESLDETCVATSPGGALYIILQSSQNVSGLVLVCESV